jgi:hypothetical protein
VNGANTSLNNLNIKVSLLNVDVLTALGIRMSLAFVVVIGQTNECLRRFVFKNIIWFVFSLVLCLKHYLNYF